LKSSFSGSTFWRASIRPGSCGWEVVRFRVSVLRMKFLEEEVQGERVGEEEEERR
jgi:hypothetical protein